jgi:hypothetical protein
MMAHMSIAPPDRDEGREQKAAGEHRAKHDQVGQTHAAAPHKSARTPGRPGG